jgi:phosphoesterase RecJ-like protein
MIQEVVETIQSHTDFLVVSHVRPDGDSLGSQLALALILQALGKNVEMLSRDPVPTRYASLPGADQVRVANRIGKPHEVTLVLECGNVDRPGIDGLDKGFIVNIDHHHSTKPFGNVSWIEPSACAVGQMIYRLMKALGVGMTQQIATNIYVAVLTDTGSFQFSSTTGDTFRLAAELADHGADVSGIAMRMFHTNPIQKVRAMGKILNAMEFHAKRRVISTVLSQDDLGLADGDDIEGLVNYPLTVAGTEVAVLLRELEDGSIRVSMRSKNEVDVSAVAAKFGGGGHRKAAGCQMVGSLRTVQQQIVSSIQNEMDSLAPSVSSPENRESDLKSS